MWNVLQSDPLLRGRKLGSFSTSSHLALVEAASWGIVFPALLACPAPQALIILQAELFSEAAFGT